MSKKNKIQYKEPQVVKVSKTSATSAQKIAPTPSLNLIYALWAVLLTLACFISVKGHEFVNWDDDRNFYENPLILTLTSENFWGNVSKIFQQDVIGNYNPITIFTFALDKQMWGLENPGMWHLENLFLHLISVFLVYVIVRRLGLAWQGAFFVAILFGIHPMRVESVAWVTERKDVLFGVFYLWAMLKYIKYKETKSTLTLIGILILFMLSLLSKIQAVSLPLSMIAMDYLIDKKISFKQVVNKWPFFLLSIIIGIIGIKFLAAEGSLETNESTYPIWQRLFVGSFSFIIYLVKWIVPFRMSPLYPYPSSIPTWFYPTILIAPIYLYAIYRAYKSNYHNIVFGLVFFLVNIVFLLQVLGAGQGYLADRFTYIAYFGLFFISGYALDKIIAGQVYKNIGIGCAIVISLIFSVMTYTQNGVWKNSDKLWSHVLKYYQKTTLPWGNRANYLRANGRWQEALIGYNTAIDLKEDAQTFNSRARLYFEVAGNSKDTLMLALKDYNKAIQMKPGDGEFHINRGATYARLGDLEKAMQDINEGLKYKPDHATGYLNRFVLYLNAGKPKEALADITEYIKYIPYEANAWYERARMERTMLEMDKSFASFKRAIELDNANGLYYYERARTYFAMSKMTEAKADLNMAIQLGYTQVEPEMQVILTQ